MFWILNSKAAKMCFWALSSVGAENQRLTSPNIDRFCFMSFFEDCTITEIAWDPTEKNDVKKKVPNLQKSALDNISIFCVKGVVLPFTRP